MSETDRISLDKKIESILGESSPEYTDRLVELKSYILNNHPRVKESLLSADALLDAVVAIYDDCKAYSSVEKSVGISRYMNNFETLVQTVRNLRINRNDFVFLRKLAKGQFGEVSLVRGKADQKVYAMKTLRKGDMLKQADIAFFMEERQILSASNVKWITSLYAAFQDEANLYLVMDYVPGGDLASILLLADEGKITIDENFAKFYIAETLLALEELHGLNYVHRDLKPGNILIDAKGHVRLADFGSCIQLQKNQITSQTVVGTPDYISPEVLQANAGNGAYGKECDFWSLGITMYEMLVGDPPFYAESLAETYHQIMSHKEYFKIPEDVSISEEAEDLMKSLVCDKADRLKTTNEIKSHSFFEHTDWNNIGSSKAPFVPVLQSDDDTSNFLSLDEEETEKPVINTNTFLNSRDRVFSPRHLPFVGFTFSKHANLAAMLVQASLDQSVVHGAKKDGFGGGVSSALSGRLTKSSLHIMESSSTALEERIMELKQKSAADTNALQEKEQLIVEYEKEKKLMAIEIEATKNKIAKNEEESRYLAGQVDELKAKLETQLSKNNEFLEECRLLKEENLKLQSNSSDFTRIIETQREQMVLLSSQLEDSKRHEEMLEKELKNVAQTFDTQNAKREASLVDRIANLEESLREAVKCRSEAQDMLAKVQRTNMELSQNLKTYQAQSNAYQVELATVKLKFEELGKKAAESSTFRTENHEKTSKESSELIKKVEELEKDKRKLGDELLLARQAKSQREQEIKTFEELLTSKDHEVRVLKEKILDIDEIFEKEKLNQSTLRDNMEKTVICLQSEKGLFERKVIELQKQISQQESDILKSRSLIDDLNLTIYRLETKTKADEMELAGHASKTENMRLKLKEAQERMQSLESKVDSSKMEIRSLCQSKTELEDALAEKQKQIVSLVADQTAADIKIQALSDTRNEYERELKALKNKIYEISNNKIDIAQYNNLSDSFQQAALEIKELRMNLESSKQKVDYLTTENEQLKAKGSESFFGFGSVAKKVGLMTPSPSDESSENSKRLRLTVTKLKTMEQKLNQEVSRRFALESEVESLKLSRYLLEQEFEEFKIQHSLILEKDHASSTVSRSNSVMSGRKPQKHETMDKGLRSGWLKLRILKGTKKNKFEWHKRFVVISDGCIYVFEKEKELVGADSRPLVELRDYLVVIRAAKPKEFIHMSAKEVSSIFCIQVVPSNASSSKSVLNLSDNSQSKQEIKKKLDSIVKNLEKEEKFKEATTKMMLISQGEAKKRAQTEIDECMRRLRTLKQEKAETEVLLASASVEPEGNDAAIESQRSLNSLPTSPTKTNFKMSEIQAEVDKKESYKKGIENMMSIVENENARHELEKQHESITKDIQVLKSSMTNLDESASSPTTSSRRLAQRFQTYEHNGHTLRFKDQTTSTTCYHCQDTVFGNMQTLECSRCRLVCHKFCYNAISVTCEEYLELKNAVVWYFMASDELERSRWILSLDYAHQMAKGKIPKRHQLAENFTSTS